MIDTPWVEPVRSTQLELRPQRRELLEPPDERRPCGSGGSTPTRANGSIGAHIRMGSAFPFTVTGRQSGPPELNLVAR